MDLVLGLGTLLLVYVLAMWGRPAGHSSRQQAPQAGGRRRWQISVDSIPEEDEGCQSDPAESIDSSDEDGESELHVPQHEASAAWQVPQVPVGLCAA